MESFLTEAEFAARYLNGARRTAQRWRTTGDGPPFVRLGPKRISYRLSDCEAWAASRTFPHRAAELAGAAATRNSTSE
jgi:predicted DNA-binding transcriptional regulator AlpA